MEERLSGFRVEGPWAEIVAHGERMAWALRQLGSTAHPRMNHEDYRDALREWEDWRPRATDSIDDDVRSRTAEQASVANGSGERRGRDPGEDLEEAGQTLVDPEDPEPAEATILERVTEAGRLATRAIDTSMRGLARRIEEAIYEHLMTKMAPCYFDNRMLSANLEKRTAGGDEYTFEININNDELKEKVSETLDTAPAIEEMAPPVVA